MDNSTTTEKEILETMNYIEGLIMEFGVLHQLVEKIIKDLVDEIQSLAESNMKLSESSIKQLTRFFERYIARRDIAEEEVKRVSKEQSNSSWLGAAIVGAVCVGAAALLYRWCRPQEPMQVLHHYDGSITDNININCSGHITEDVRLRLLN